MKNLLLPFFLVFITIHLSGQTRWYVNQAAIGLNDGTSWGHAYSNLQTAISACSIGDTLWIASGTYHPHLDDRTESFVLDGLVILGGFSGDETSSDQRKPIENTTILSGDLNGDDDGFVNNSENSKNIIKVAPDGNSCTIDGFIIEGGNAEGAYGGGIYFSTGNSTLLSISNCVFRNNKANSGGAIYLLNTMLSTSFLHSVNIENCVFENNSSIMNGSAIFRYGNIKLSLTNCTFISNPNIVLFNTSSDYVLRVTNSIFLDHTGTDYIASYDGSYAFDHCLFDNNPSGFTGSFTNNYTDTEPLLKEDFQLSPASPARDAGINDPVSTSRDLAGLNRIMNETVDIGAYEFNTTPPEVAISTGFSETNDTLIEASVVFNEFISGLESGDFEITNATMSSLTEVNPGLEYTLSISHNLTGQVTIEVPDASIQNANEIGNNNYSFSYTYTDTIIPRATLLPEYAITSSLTQELSVMFSDEVTGLELSDFLITNGSASNLQTITEGFGYSVDITAGADGEVIITLPAGAVNDLNTLPNDTSRISYTYSAINGLYSSNITDITIYPNPATDYVIIDTKGFLCYEIYTETGVQIAEGNNEYIDISVIKKGIYFLRVHTDDKIISGIKLLLIR